MSRKVVQELEQVALIMAIVMRRTNFVIVIAIGKALDVTCPTVRVILMTATIKVCLRISFSLKLLSPTILDVKFANCIIKEV